MNYAMRDRAKAPRVSPRQAAFLRAIANGTDAGAISRGYAAHTKAAACRAGLADYDVWASSGYVLTDAGRAWLAAHAGSEPAPYTWKLGNSCRYGGRDWIVIGFEPDGRLNLGRRTVGLQFEYADAVSATVVTR